MTKGTRFSKSMTRPEHQGVRCVALGGKAGPGQGRAGEKAGRAGGGGGGTWLELGEEGEGGGKWDRGERASRTNRAF